VEEEMKVGKEEMPNKRRAREASVAQPAIVDVCFLVAVEFAGDRNLV
jgi:hypothetical protein